MPEEGCIECAQTVAKRDVQKEETYKAARAYAKKKGLRTIVICKTINGALFTFRERGDESLTRLPIIEYLFID